MGNRPLKALFLRGGSFGYFTKSKKHPHVLIGLNNLHSHLNTFR